VNCKNHCQKQSVANCQKHQVGYCKECCECQDLTECCGCSDPNLYCKFRSQCLIWELSRSRRKTGKKVLQSNKRGNATTKEEQRDENTTLSEELFPSIHDTITDKNLESLKK